VPTLEAGCELNARMHEFLGWRHLTGLDVPEPAHHLRDGLTAATQDVWMRDGHWQCVRCGNGPDDYSEDMRAAWEVAEYMRAHGQSFDLNWGEDNNLWECSWITSGKRYSGFSKSATLAICHAALAAVKAKDAERHT
jgi:hypothetical protein